MIARASKLFLPTLREAPADAEAASHRLLVRGGFIRQVGAGIWSFLPLGWRVHMRIEQIIREEIDAIGGQEMLARRAGSPSRSSSICTTAAVAGSSCR
jgi:prolyl-tRNA synthetase